MGIGHAIKVARAIAQCTQFELARRLGWHQVRVVRVEQGAIDPSEEEIRRISEALQVNVLEVQRNVVFRSTSERAAQNAP